MEGFKMNVDKMLYNREHQLTKFVNGSIFWNIFIFE